MMKAAIPRDHKKQQAEGVENHHAGIERPAGGLPAPFGIENRSAGSGKECDRRSENERDEAARQGPEKHAVATSLSNARWQS